MSTESERRLPGDTAANEPASTAQSGSRYDRHGAQAPDTGRAPADAERIADAAGSGTERTANPEAPVADARPTGDTDRPTRAGVAPESSENIGAERSVPGAERVEDARPSGGAPYESATQHDSVAASGGEPTAASGGEPTAASGGEPTAAAAGAGPAPLFAEADFDRLRTQWREVQVTFVDDPRTAVARADDLVGDTINQMIATYQQRKRELDQRRGDTSDTEDLRQALRGYRAFFDQLLSTGA
ncbi:hypothetical protein ACRS6B_21075 [Nocardia asteroides]